MLNQEEGSQFTRAHTQTQDPQVLALRPESSHGRTTLTHLRNRPTAEALLLLDQVFHRVFDQDTSQGF